MLTTHHRKHDIETARDQFSYTKIHAPSSFHFLLRLVPKLPTHTAMRNQPDTCVCVYVRDSYRKGNLVGDTNDTASRARTSVTSLLGLLVAALAEIVGTGVDDDGALFVCVSSGYRKRVVERERKKTYANNALRPDQLDQLISVASLSVTLAISLEVAQVTNVALLVVGRTVSLVLGVDYDPSAATPIPIQVSLQLTMRTSGRAAIGVIAESVNVHAALSVGVVASNVPRDGGVGRLVSLLKGDGSLDIGVSTEDGDCRVISTWFSFFSPTRSGWMEWHRGCGRPSRCLE